MKSPELSALEQASGRQAIAAGALYGHRGCASARAPARFRGGLLALSVLTGLLLPAGASATTAGCPNEALRGGASAALPDCRAYEQVSPPEKNGLDATSRYRALPAQATPNGDALAYLGYSSFPGSVGSTALFDAHLARRGEAGWGSVDLTPPKTTSGPPGNYEVEYDFSEDLAQSALGVPLQDLAPGATPGMYNLFLRDEAGGYSLLNSIPPLVPPPGSCSERKEPNCYAQVDLNAFAGASSDFSHVLFESTAQYGEGAPEGESLYESALEGAQRVVRLVGVLPNGEAAETSTAGAGSIAEVGGSVEDARLMHAVSADGARIVFEAPANGAEPYEEGQAGSTEVYDRIDHDTTGELSAPIEGSKPAGPVAGDAEFWAASADGERVLFTSAAGLTTDANTDGGVHEDLYEYDFEVAAGDPRLRDVSADPAEAEGARVLGVVGASEDARAVYFVAEGALAAGATPGRPNLYFERPGEAPVFIAALDGERDAGDWTAHPSEDDAELGAYLAPGGSHLAFDSVESLPTAEHPAGYDNRDASSGLPDAEVYLYTAPEAAGSNGTLVCASCGASEGPPTGPALLGGVAPQGSPGTPFHRPRAVSDGGGRLFFTAPDPAGARAVYEYERPGEGTCGAAPACTFAISAPDAGAEDVFLDASASGGDVFFATASVLAPSDEDQLEDVYDARVDGGFAATSSPTCETDCRTPGAETLDAPPIVSGTAGPSGNLPSNQQRGAGSGHRSKAAKSKRPRRSCGSHNTAHKHLRRSKSRRRVCRKKTVPRRVRRPASTTEPDKRHALARRRGAAVLVEAES